MTPVESLLLDMLSSTRPVTTDQMAAMAPADWDRLGTLARQHRLEPMLHHLHQHHGPYWTIPDPLAAGWSDRFRHAALRSLGFQQALQHLKRVLGDAGLAFVTLKGGWLAWHCYPHAALRPMRDLDILVSPARVLEAYNVLQQAGYARPADSNVPIELALTTYRHLPPLICPRSGTMIEVHHCLMLPSDGTAIPSALADIDALLDRSGSAPGDGLHYLPPTENLLHLIHHAVKDHLFSNGPVVLTDIDLLLKKCAIDWPHFWTMAQEGGWTSACILALEMVEYYHGVQPVSWPSPRPHAPQPILLASAALCVQDRRLRADHGLQMELARHSSHWARLKSILARLWPERHVLAQIGGVAADSKWAWLSYPRWLVRSFGKFRASLGADKGAHQAVIGWLD